MREEKKGLGKQGPVRAGAGHRPESAAALPSSPGPWNPYLGYPLSPLGRHANVREEEEEGESLVFSVLSSPTPQKEQSCKHGQPV